MYHARALILKKEEWGEADRMIVALTPDFGKIRLLVQGARKHGAKLQGHLEPGCSSFISFVIARGGYRITTARLEESFERTRNSLSKLRTRDGILAAVDKNMLEDSDGADELFEMVIQTVRQIEQAEHVRFLERLSAWFYVRFASFLGVLPHPNSREGMEFQTMTALASSALSDIADFPVREGAIGQELKRFMAHSVRAGDGSFTVEAKWFTPHQQEVQGGSIWQHL